VLVGEEDALLEQGALTQVTRVFIQVDVAHRQEKRQVV